MAYYRVYQEVPETYTMTVRGGSPDQRLAIKAANALMWSRPMPLGMIPETGVPGIITGIPVWVRNKAGRGLAVMVTENDSREQAHDREARARKASDCTGIAA